MGVVLLSAHAEVAYALTLLEEGSRGRAYLLKEHVAEPRQLVGAIQEVARGGSIDRSDRGGGPGWRPDARASVAAQGR